MKNQFPAGWNEDRVQRILEHYEGQDEVEAVEEDQVAFEMPGQTMMAVPKRLVPEITQLIERRSRIKRRKPTVVKRRHSKSRP